MSLKNGKMTERDYIEAMSDCSKGTLGYAVYEIRMLLANGDDVKAYKKVKKLAKELGV
jgi:hypothetical protein